MAAEARVSLGVRKNAVVVVGKTICAVALLRSASSHSITFGRGCAESHPPVLPVAPFPPAVRAYRRAMVHPTPAAAPGEA